MTSARRPPFEPGVRAGDGTTSPSTPAASGQARSGGSRKWPVHVAVALGLGTGVYAFSLATVVGLQANTDRALIADREPVRQAIDMLGTTHDSFAAGLDAARLRYAAAAEGYGALTADMEGLRARLDDLGVAIREIEGIDVSAPTTTSGSGSTRTGSSTKKSGSSGGTSGSGTSSTGSSGSSGSSTGGTSKSGGGTVVVVPPPPPPPTPPPTTQGTTGASGAPP